MRPLAKVDAQECLSDDLADQRRIGRMEAATTGITEQAL
jgi:hypothetical protein